MNYDEKLPLTFKGAGFLEVRASDSVELELIYQAKTNIEVTILLLQFRSYTLLSKCSVNFSVISTLFDLIQSTRGLCELTQKKNVLVYKSDSLKETVELPLNKTTSIVVRLQPHLTIKCGKNEWVIVRASKTEIKYFCAA